MTRGFAGGTAQDIRAYLMGALAVLLSEAVALVLTLLLPPWLTDVIPSLSQLFVLLLIGVLAGYIAELILRGPRPLGYAGSALSAIVGAWVGSNVLPRSPLWDWPISTSQGNVPVITSFGLALLTALAWRGLGLLFPSSPVRGYAAALRQRLQRAAQTPLNNGSFVGFVVGSVIGWGAVVVYIHSQGAEPATFLSWLVTAILVVGLGRGWWQLLAKNGFRAFGQPLDRWWQLAAAGCALGLASYILVGVLYPV